MRGCWAAKKGRCSPCSLAKSKLRVAPLPPLRGAFDSPCAPWPSDGVGTWRNRRVGPNQASKLVSAEATTLARRNAMSHQELYVGLDVSLEKTSICVVDYQGATIGRG